MIFKHFKDIVRVLYVLAFDTFSTSNTGTAYIQNGYVDNFTSVIFYYFTNFFVILIKLLKKTKNMLNEVPTSYYLSKCRFNCIICFILIYK